MISIENCYGSETLLHDTIMVDVSLYTFVQSHGIYSTKSVY